MRYDVVIDKKGVKLPKALSYGFYKSVANLGDIVVYHDEPVGNHVARVIGRVHESTDSFGGLIKDWLLVVTLSQDLTFPMERWVNPEEVVICYNPAKDPELPEFLSFFFGPEFMKHSPKILREWAASSYRKFSDFENREGKMPE